MSGPQLELDVESHVYRWGGAIVPSVTQILESASMYSYLFRVRPARLELAQARGRAVHKAIELYTQDQLDWSTVSDEVAPYLEGYVQWAADRNWRPRLIEHRFYHPTYKFAGTLDQSGLLGPEGEEAVVDFKSPLVFGIQARAAARLQLAAYCYHAPKPLMYRRVVLHLPGNGKYHERHYASSTLARDFQIFLAALSVHNYKQQERLI